MVTKFGVVSIPNVKRILLYRFFKCLSGDVIALCEHGCLLFSVYSVFNTRREIG